MFIWLHLCVCVVFYNMILLYTEAPPSFWIFFVRIATTTQQKSLQNKDDNIHKSEDLKR